MTLINNRYQLDTRIGSGGMGTVHRAIDRLTGQVVALKQVQWSLTRLIFKSRHTETSIGVALAREFQTLASLRHPNIISVLDYGFDDSKQPYFTMPLLEHPQTIVEAAATQTLINKAELLIQLLQALAYLHRRGILHRDLKPANVLVEQGKQVRVLDFGLAVEAEQATGTAGTFAYMAPEMISQQEATVASDLYSVGVMAYEIFLGKHPYSTEDLNQMIWDILHTVPDQMTTDHTVIMIPFNTDAKLKTIEIPHFTDDTIRQRITPILKKLLHKAPIERYQTAEAVIEDLSIAIGQPPPPESQAIRESFLQAAKFVGRDIEMKVLQGVLKTAIEGRGAAWLIGGESGVGKSRLVDELSIRAMVQGVLVLRGQSVRNLPFGLWREPLRRLLLTSTLSDLDAGVLKSVVPDIEAILCCRVAPVPRLEGEAWLRRLQTAIAHVLRQQKQPILLIWEDMQWETNMVVVNHVIEQIQDRPILIVGTFRNDEAPHVPSTVPHMQVIKLARLDAKSIAELSASMLGSAPPPLVEFLQRETEGNAFFLIEVVRALAEEAGQLSEITQHALPEHVVAGGIQQVVQRRLSKVPNSARPLLKWAAVIGRRIDWELLRALAPATDLDTWYMACAGAAVLELREGQPRFAHDKLRESLLDSLSPQEHITLSRQVAEAIERVYAHNLGLYARRLMIHWQHAHQPKKELHYLLRVAEQMIELAAMYESAETLLKHGLTLTSDPVDCARICRLFGDIEVNRAHYAQAYTYYAESLQLAEQAHQVSLIADCHLGMSRVAMNQSQYADAIRHAQRGLAIFRLLEDDMGWANCLTVLGTVAFRQSHYEQALEYFQQSLALTQNLDATREIARNRHHIGGVLRMVGRYAEAREHFEASLKLSQAIGDQQGMSDTYNNLGNLALNLGHYDEAKTHYEQSLVIQRAIGNKKGEASVLNNLGIIERNRGHFEAAFAYYEQSYALYSSLGTPYEISIALQNLGTTAYFRKDYATATRYYDEALAIRQQINDQRGIANAYYNLGTVAYKQMEFDRAYPFYEQALAVRRTIGDIRGVVECLAQMGNIQRLQNDLVKAEALLREAVELVMAIDAPSMGMETLVEWAYLIHKQGQSEQAARWSGLVLTHASASHDDREAVRELLPQLETALGKAACDRAVQAGASLELKAVLGEIMLIA